MEMSLIFALLILSHFFVAHAADLFISIDCGSNIPYNDPVGYTWLGDGQFVQTGLSAKVRSTNPVDQPLTTLRYFPVRRKNCYVVPGITPGSTVMVRAAFCYGNYDGLSSPPTFDLLLDPNRWATITTSLDQTVTQELLYIAGEDKVTTCVAQTQPSAGVPFISSLEVRVVDKDGYSSMKPQFALFMLCRHAFGSAQALRYPDDIYDRVWLPYTGSPGVVSVTSKQTNLSNNAQSHPPMGALLHAITPADINATTLDIPLPTNLANEATDYYFNLYFTEVVPNASRAFSIVSDGTVSYEGPEIPPWGNWDLLCGASFSLASNSTITLVRKPPSALPPLINAAEFFLMSDQFTSGSDATNLKAIRALQSSYPQLQAWSGDPCLPVGYNWEWLDCNSDPAPHVTSLYLSGYGLTGTLSDFSVMVDLQIIDLHNNSLSGSIPDFLGRFPYLKELNLADNHFSGPLPASLVNNPNIKLNISGNNMSGVPPSPKRKGVNLGLIAGPIAGGVVVLCLVVSLIVLSCKGTTHADISAGTVNAAGVNPPPNHVESNQDPTPSEKGQRPVIPQMGSIFTYSEIVEITKNFACLIGSGGSGDVYHGEIKNDREVAVKVIKDSHPRGAREFETEIMLLLTVRHKFLALCVGYCDEGKNLILLYEYMPGGNLRDLLSGKSTMSGSLTWEKRLEVALSVAIGLDYLHSGCQPPIVHRDVKSTNILLNESLQAKLADFGLCKVGSNNEVTFASTVIAGTSGYIDPEYYTTTMLTRKSDVYSFGVVLFELITGHTPIITTDNQKIAVGHWARKLLARGDIHIVADPKLEGKYNVNSVWKAADLAIQCTEAAGVKRPNMDSVVNQLKDVIDIETDKLRSEVPTTEIAPSAYTQDSNSHVVSLPTAR